MSPISCIQRVKKRIEDVLCFANPQDFINVVLHGHWLLSLFIAHRDARPRFNSIDRARGRRKRSVDPAVKFISSLDEQLLRFVELNLGLGWMQILLIVRNDKATAPAST